MNAIEGTEGIAVNSTNKNEVCIDINEILDGYLICALFSNDFVDESYCDNDYFSINDFSLSSVNVALADIQKFMKNAGNAAIYEAIDINGCKQLGIDIWLTRNGHVAGFFDHKYVNEKSLIKAAKQLGDIYLDVDSDYNLFFLQLNILK